LKTDFQQLISGGKFFLFHSLSYERLIDFVFSSIKKSNLSTWVYYSSNIGFLILLIYQSGDIFFRNFMGWGIFALNFFLGLVIFPVLLIPVHEMIHALAYKLLGARKIRFGADLSQFIFFVTADKFVIGFRELILVALLPFVLISGLLLLFFFYFEWQINYSFLLTLIAHGVMCIGDFAIMSYFIENDPYKLLTFDIVDEKKAYFYKRKDSEQ
jgi:hypothetical protein